MDLPIIIVEFGQQRQRVQLNKFYFHFNELLELFSKTFQTSFNSLNYEILLSNKRLDSIVKLDFTQIVNYQRFKIQLNNNRTNKSIDQMDSSCSLTINNEDELISLKQRLNKASTEITNVAFLINSISRNYQNLINTLMNEENSSICSNKLTKICVHRSSQDLTVPPGFKPLSHQQSFISHKQLNSSPRDSQSTDEGIDRDTGSVSIFESAHSDYEHESVYLECREDITIINESNPILINDNNKLKWPIQSYRSRSQWNSNKVKYQPNYTKDQFSDQPRSKKPVSLTKAPLPAEKKKNIPCKYAAGGNCKRGSQCRFIHVV